MELRHLEYFVAVAEERHFTRAAQRLMVSQSGLSASVRALERELGARLFVRSTRRVELTGAGHALLVEASRALASVWAGREAVAAVQGLLRGTLSVGTEQCVTGVHVPGLLARFRSEHPEVEVRLRQAGSASLVEDVADGRLDLAFVAVSGAVPEGVRLVPLASEPMVLLCHPGHPLAGSEKAEWAELGGEVFVDFHEDWGARGLTDRAFAAARIERRVALEVNDVHSLIELVGHRLGIAVVPRPIARKEQAAALRTVPLAGAEDHLWEVSAAVPEDQRTGPAARELLSYLTRAGARSSVPDLS
ncbi:LysR family transcriptional regulator [Streptomyces scopuliridis]|uniref:LysR family transcriptional regulator n=1 Tax=Streptomyces scopuliridis TaxID=452529 RepID=A0ACD4ZE00_9ACTN|nr:LysR family transcriptional regulator [Streptomyces scopuliridis]WSB96584.1 LysR family transcriptional regulator [Streptomyces scopuliridis]WSC09712.1 LysR family transcriptional regulator [Streptomyces scopuliridis]